jgi:MFS family permease
VRHPAPVRDVLSLPDFRRLFAGSAASALADQVFPVAVAVLVLDRGGTAGDLGLVLAARFAAIALFGLLGGVFADRLPRVTMLVSADLLRCVAVTGLVVATAADPGVLVLAALVFVVGSGEAFFRPAYGALVPTVLPAALLPKGNALSSSTSQLAQVVGPGTGGLLIAAAGPRAGLVLVAVMFLLSALLLLRVREPAAAGHVRETVLRDIRIGFAAVLARRWMAVCLGMFTFNMLAVLAPVQVLLPVIVRDSTGETASYGFVLAVGALGGLAGALVAGHWRRPAAGRTAVLGLMLFAAEPLALLAEAPLPGLAAAWVVSSAGIGFFIVRWETALQTDVPRHLLARVVSVDWMATFALYPVGLALTGPAVEAVGRTPVLVFAAVAALVPPLLVLRVPGMAEFRTPSGPPAERVEGRDVVG